MFPNKLLGQHFLRDHQALAKIIQASDLLEKDIVLEVGPGHGELTFELAKRAGQVLAVEKDKRLAEELKKRFNENKNVEIIEGDILKLQHPPSDSPPLKRGEKKRKKSPPLKKGEGKIPPFNFPPLKKGGYKVVANIPYYLTSHLIKNFLEAKNPPKLMVLMLQKEVAQRICSRPPHMSLLAVSVQVYAEPKIISFISKKSFWPQPKVDSAIIKITRIKPSPLSISPLSKGGEKVGGRMKNFFKLVKAGFSSPRKKLINNLSIKLNLPKQKISIAFEKCGFSQNTRAQELSVENWQDLAHMLLDKNIV